MNNTFFRSRRFRYGGIAVIFTCVLIAAIILVNAIFSALAHKFLWYTDLTSENMYTLTDAAVEALSPVERDVTILFCDDPDNLTAEYTQRLVYETALELEKRVPFVHVETVNIWRNPTAVTYYKTTSKSDIYSTSIIIYSGTEFRVHSLRSMFTFNDATSTEPWAYNGEKKLVAAILAVTQAESPVACITYNHGEPFSSAEDLASSAELLYLLEDAGYKIQPIDLANAEIPEDCRLLVIYNPLDDFLVKDGVSDKSEIEKIDRFLDGTNAMTVFMSPTSPVLPNFEEYLEEWGVKILRHTDALGTVTGASVKDDMNSITRDGMTVVGQYTTKGLGSSVHSDLRTTYPPKVIFKNAAALGYTYDLVNYVNEDDPTDSYLYGSYYVNGVSRSITDLFISYPTATLMAGGVKVDEASELEPYHLMTMTRETRMVTNEDADYSYVLACGSTEFLSNTMLQSNSYGNDDVMLSALRAMGKEFVPVGLEIKPFASTEIESLTSAEANQYTAFFTLAPVIIVFGLAIFVLVRRKYA